jgi:hypothetical protein
MPTSTVRSAIARARVPSDSWSVRAMRCSARRSVAHPFRLNSVSSKSSCSSGVRGAGSVLGGTPVSCRTLRRWTLGSSASTGGMTSMYAS